jgi:uncharacterized protein (DUF2236 family)
MDILRQVSGERLVVLGWTPAMLMQFAHPLIAAGVSDHSAFKGRVSEATLRLHHTIGAMLALSFGTDGERDAALSRIRAIHKTVNGTLPEHRGPFPRGTPYSAEDPALLLWVHLTLIDRTADVFQRIVRPLSARELDLLTQLSAPLLIELGGDAAIAPQSWCALRRQLDEAVASGTINVTATARAMADAVLAPRAAGLPVPLIGWHRLLSVGLLPPAIREGYGFKWNAKSEARFMRILKLLRIARRITPDAVARFRQAR